MKTFSVLCPSDSHDEYVQGRRIYRFKAGDKRAIPGLLLEEDREKHWHFVPIGMGRVPVRNDVRIRRETYTLYSRGSYPAGEHELFFADDLKIGRTNDGSPLLVPANGQTSDDAIVLIRIEPGYKSNSRITGRNGCNIVALQKMEGHKASWPEAVVRLTPGGMAVICTRWKTMNNDGERGTGVFWDGKEVKIGDPDEIDPPSKWSLTGSEVL